MCIKSEFPIDENTTLTINNGCSVTLCFSVFGNEVEEPDWDVIQVSQDAARKIAKILTEELG